MGQASNDQQFQHLSQAQLADWMHQIQLNAPHGTVPNYIPQLAEADPDRFAVQIQLLDGKVHACGDIQSLVPLMSAVKPFLLLYLLEQLGPEEVFSVVGMQPSELPYHSLIQLEADQNRPRNPMINSGAIALADRLPGRDAETRCQNLCEWLNQQSGSQWQLDQTMLASVRSRPNPTNQTIGDRLQQAGCLENRDMALDVYQQICCLSGTVTDLAASGLMLANAQFPQISANHRRIVNFLMLTCGLYDASAKYAVEIGLPMKSSVSGLLLAIVPRQGVIACYSPLLDPAGNSVAGLLLIQTIAQALNLNRFG